MGDSPSRSYVHIFARRWMISRRRFLMLASCILSCPAMAQVSPTAQLGGPPFTAKDATEGLEIGDIEDDSLKSGPDARRLYLLKPSNTDTVQLEVTSDDIDSVIEVYEESGLKPIASDDDSGGVFDSLLLLPPRETQSPLIVLVKDADGRGGRFKLRAGKVSSAPVTVGINGPPVDGQLRNESPRETTQGRIYEQYQFSGQAGQRIQVDAISSDFDTLIELRRGGVYLGRDEDSGVATNARLVRTLTETGDYNLRVATQNQKIGPFSLSIATVTKAGPIKVAPLGNRTRVEGIFDLQSSTVDDRANAYYSVPVQAGRTILAEFEGFDSLGKGRPPQVTLEAGVDTPLGFVVIQRGTAGTIAKNDSTFSRAPAKLTIAPQSRGTIILRLRSDLDFLGPYRLSVTEVSEGKRAEK